MKKTSMFVAMLLTATYAVCGPLHDAVRDGNLTEAHNLIAAGADVNEPAPNSHFYDNTFRYHGETPLQLAARNGDIDMVQCLVEAGADVDFNPRNNNWGTPLSMAAEQGHMNVVEYLVKAGADVNMQYYGAPLHYAAKRGDLEMVEFLVDHGANVNAPYNRSALLLAAQGQHFDVVKYLIKKGADVNFVDPVNGGTSLHSAAYAGRVDVMEDLLAAGADINARSARQDGEETPLYVATYRRQLNAVEYLIEKGADVTLQGILGTPLHASVYHGEGRLPNLDITKALVEAVPQEDRVAYINTREDNLPGEETALIYACTTIYSDIEIVKYLIENGADVEAATYDNKTALHAAAKAGKLEIVQYLVEHGADKFLNEKGGFYHLTPLELAIKEGRTDVVNYLKQEMQQRNLI